MSGFRSKSRGVAATLFALASGVGCSHQQQQPQPVYTWGPSYAQPGTVAPGAPAPVAAPGTVPVVAVPGAAPVATGAPTLTTITPNDPINTHDLMFLRGRAQQIMNQLEAALPATQQARVNGIPLVIDSTPGEVNAFASCSGSSPALAVSDGLFQIESQLARFRAYDEIAGSNKVGEYIALIARSAQPDRPLPEPPAGFADPRFDLDPRKGTRQYQILDEEIAFVIGHELGHHYLGHLPCTAISPLTLGQLNGVLANAVPAFNQPNEVAADMVGINNTLTMGSRQPAYHLTEGGALLTMQFFAGLEQLSAASLFDFQRTHPPAQLRTPIIQQTANTWRATGGVGLPIISF